MTVGKLIEQLQKFDKDKNIYTWNEHYLVHDPVISIREFKKEHINQYLYDNDKDYRKDINKILNNIIIL